ncbi:DUF2851 family protein [Flavobacterium sp.]|uniref:DUF2851 family protein n=1 Tax=Flavobacterium sp. TaxID=239 RepID=UPI0026394483|nr:DUF2851 family protein [Flavobacterium sp.]MDG2431676.1 DUF2851 family protein [Flavobacterium sp.]
MKEAFLHYLWKFKKMDVLHLRTTTNEEIQIIAVGQYLEKAGPDFFNAQLIIGSQKWAGNVEIHLKSSDWYVHNHERDEAYENVILHVVWEHDSEIFRKDNSCIPVLELKNYVDHKLVLSYQDLVASKSWIFCEKYIKSVDPFTFSNWQEVLFLERLERKSLPILELLKRSNNDWEAVLFCLLAKNFGLNTNGDAFLKMASSIPFSVIRKECSDVFALESLFFGSVGLLELDREDTYFKELKKRYTYLSHKYRLEENVVEKVQFFKHRPDNFPTIRLAQLAGVYHHHHNLFSKLIDCKSMTAIYAVFDVFVSDYWENHYVFDKVSPSKRKKLSRSFIDLILINTIIPLRFTYDRSQGKDNVEDLIQLLNDVSAEKNVVIEKFASFGIKSKNAFDSQSLLQLKNEYCNRSRCLECAVGIRLLKQP